MRTRRSWAARSVGALICLLGRPGPNSATGQFSPIEEYWVVDGLWIDPLSDTPRAFTAGMTGLTSESEAQQRAGMAIRLFRDSPLAAEQAAAVDTYIRRVDQAIRAGEWTRAFLEARDGLAISPNHPLLLSRAATITLHLRQYDRAQHYFSRYLELMPNDAVHMAGQALCLIFLARLPEADAVLRRAAAVAPDELALRYARSLLRLVREEGFDDADYWRRRSLEELHTLTAWLNHQQEDLERLLGPADVRQLHQHLLGPGLTGLMPGLQSVLQEAVRLRATRRWSELRSLLEPLERAGADRFGVQAAYADALILSGAAALGLQRWQAVTRSYPDLPLAWASYGLQLLRTDRIPEALPPLAEASRLAPHDPLIRFLNASALALNGQTDKAQEIFDQLLLSYSQSVRTWIENEPVLERALRRVRNAPNYFRTMGIPPELE